MELSKMLITEDLSHKAMYARKENAKKEALRKVELEFSDSSKVSDGFLFDSSHMAVLVRSILDCKGVKQAYIDLKEQFALPDVYVKKAKSRHAYKSFEAALLMHNAHSIVPTLNKYKLYNKGYLKCYYNEQVTTGLIRLANNVEIVSELNKLQNANDTLLKEKSSLQFRLSKLETGSHEIHKNWFYDIAIPMKKRGKSIKEISEMTGRSVSTINQRFRRFENATL